MKPTDYPVVIEPVPKEDVGGFVASVPDLPGCMSDGEAPQDALANVGDATAAWIEAQPTWASQSLRHHGAR